MNALLDAALAYAARGWRVFPLRPRKKKPQPFTHGLLDATTDAAVIEQWWSRWHDANIGLQTGEVFHVLDLDGPIGIGRLAEACEEHGLLGAGPSVATPGRNGGFHLYFAPPSRRIGNRAGFLRGCDWRGAGGYVVAPPSVHPNGGSYEWSTDPDVEVEPPNAWLVDLLDPPRPPPRPAPDLGGARGDRYALAALDSEVRAVASAPVGKRNDTLNKAAFSMGQFIGAGAVDPELVASRLLGAAVIAGLGDAEARRTLASGLKDGTARPREIHR